MTDAERVANMTRVNRSIFDAVVQDIPDAVLRDRAVRWLHIMEADHIAIVADPAPQGNWAKPWREPLQGFGGGGLKGGFIMLCLAGKIVKGHYELTEGALTGAGFRGPGVKFVASASRDPDQYEWFNPAAHGQTDSNAARGDPLGPSDVEVWKQKYRDWMALNVRRVAQACNNSEFVEAGYVLGYVLHGVQDLASHHGITNSEHSYLSYAKTNPDAVAEQLEVATRWSVQTVQTLDSKLRSGCLDKIVKVGTNARVPAAAAQYYGPEDVTLDALWEYRNLGPKYEDALKKGRPGLHVEWFSIANAREGDEFFNKNVIDAINAL
jgi:hypothetical protein